MRRLSARRSGSPDQADDLPDDPELVLSGPHDDWREGRMLGLQDDGFAIPREALDRRLPVNERDDDLAGLGMVLPAHHDDIAVDDVRVHHALAVDPQAEDLVGLGPEP